MNKKTLDKIVKKDHFNQLLFNSSIQIVQTCQTLTKKAQNLPKSQKTAIKQKQIQLQNAIKNAIKMIGKFANVSKTTPTPLDYGIEIFQAITDNIQTSVQKYKQANNNKNAVKQHELKQKKAVQRPQDIYPDIKPIAFDYHNHEKTLQYIRTDINFIKSAAIQSQYAYVSNINHLEQMIQQLLGQNQIAVDVQHSNKSYNGLTCLLQFSSRKKDYIVDVFPLWKDIPLLKKIMQNEKIIKVMHGAEMDTKWFQRDFNIHIVNLFDSYRAARVLGFPKFSYAYLLNYYCNVNTDKTYQLADWRQRPLSTQMLHYARLDTHYLLQIFDRLRADIYQKSLTMNLVPEQVITDVYASSYEVTKNQVELFDFRKKQFYLQLKKDTKNQQDFKVFDKIFSILDNLAQSQDMSFDQLVTHKLERHIIARIKEILYHKTHKNVNIKIDGFLSIFKQGEKGEIFKKIMNKIKQQLDLFINSQEIQHKKVNKTKVNKKSKIMHIEEQKITEQNHKYGHHIKQFTQYNIKTYESMNFNPFKLLVFQPIAKFLSKGFNVIDESQMKAEEQAQQSGQQEGSQDELLDQEVNIQQQDKGIIQFKRMNPNVIYTIQEAVQIEKSKPRKIKRDSEYERKLKNKQGNIFQLLQE